MKSGGQKYINHCPKEEGFSPLLAAICNSKISDKTIMERILVFDEVDVNLEGNQLPLTAAIRKNRSSALISELVVRRKADVNQIEKATKIPSIVLAVSGSGLTLKCSGEHDSDADEIGKAEETTASEKSGVSDAGSSVLHSEDDSRGSAATETATKAKRDVITADVKSQSKPAKTECLAHFDDENLDWQKAVVSTLVEARADILLEDVSGFTALTRCYSPSLMRHIVDIYDTKHINPQQYRVHEQRFVDVNIKDARDMLNHVPSCGKSPLVLAAGCNNVEMVEYLLDSNADINLYGIQTSIFSMMNVYLFSKSYLIGNVEVYTCVNVSACRGRLKYLSNNTQQESETLPSSVISGVSLGSSRQQAIRFHTPKVSSGPRPQRH